MRYIKAFESYSQLPSTVREIEYDEYSNFINEDRDKLIDFDSVDIKKFSNLNLKLEYAKVPLVVEFKEGDFDGYDMTYDRYEISNYGVIITIYRIDEDYYLAYVQGNWNCSISKSECYYERCFVCDQVEGVKDLVKYVNEIRDKSFDIK